MRNIFNSISLKRNKYNRFNLSFENKLSCNMGQLIPVLCQDVLPGDRFKIKTEQIIRLAPLQAPMMQRVDVFFHYFFVPTRLIWDDFEKFITGGQDGKQRPVYPVNELYSSDNSLLQPSGLLDYLGYPSVVNNGSAFTEIDTLPVRAYNLIYNEYYRDQNIDSDFAPVPFGSGLNNLYYKDKDGVVQSLPTTNSEFMKLRYRSWKKDYFTSALPFAQRGSDVVLPFKVGSELIFSQKAPTLVYNSDGTLPSTGSLMVRQNGQLRNTDTGGSQTINNVHNYQIENTTVDGTITDLRHAIKVQEWLERMARGGSRYIEQIRSFFGVKGDDYRLQRPIYLGGGKSPVVVSEVAQTSQTTSSSPLGTLGATGTNVSANFAFNRSFKEHGYIMCIMSIMPKASYFQGMPRKYLKRDKFDYYWPQFAHIGEQGIYNAELYYQPQSISNFVAGLPNESNVNVQTFGYTPRYAEYRFNNDEIHGAFRDSLSYWHMGRSFSNLPTLNKEFITANDESNYRPFVLDTSQDEHFYCQIYHNILANRQIPRYGTPSI